MNVVPHKTVCQNLYPALILVSLKGFNKKTPVIEFSLFISDQVRFFY
jgi:hypothetical protein